MTHFLIGFLAGCALCATLAALYLVRARRRVAAIQQAIRHYQQASSVVGQACDELCRDQQESLSHYQQAKYYPPNKNMGDLLPKKG